MTQPVYPTYPEESFSRFDEEEIDGAEGPGLLQSLLRYAWLLALIAVLGAVAGYMLSARQPTLYVALSRMVLTDPRAQGLIFQTQQANIDPDRYLRDQAAIVTSKQVVERAMSSVGLTERPPVSADASEESSEITIGAADEDPARAAAMATAVGAAYQQVMTERAAEEANQAVTRLQAEGEALRAVIAATGDRTDARAQADRQVASELLAKFGSRERELAIEAALSKGGVELREDAAVPDEPFQPNPRRAAAAGGLVGLVLGAGAAWWLGLRRSVREAGAYLEQVVGLPRLGDIPDFGPGQSVPTASASASPAADAYQFLLAAVTVALRRTNARSVLITSVRPGEGKTVTATNLVVAASADGREAVLVNADLRKPAGKNGRAEPVPAHPDLLRTFGFIDVAIEPAAFFRSERFRSAMDVIREDAELVVVDTPPFLDVADAFEVAAEVDGIILVVAPDTPVPLVTEACRRIALQPTPLIGFVVNRSEAPAAGRR